MNQFVTEGIVARVGKLLKSKRCILCSHTTKLQTERSEKWLSTTVGMKKVCTKKDVNSTAQGFSVKYTMTDDSYFNNSVTHRCILYLIPVTPKCDIIWTENNDVTDSFILEISKYEL